MLRSHDWLSTLARESLGDFELTPEIDADLSLRAVAARSDPIARDELFALLALKLRRFCARFGRWNLAPWQFDDVLQEAYLVFVDVLAAWEPATGPNGPTGFGFYLHRVFPLRLADRVQSLVRTRRDRPNPVLWLAEVDDRLDPDDMERDIVAREVIAAIVGLLNATDATIFHLRVTSDDPLHLIAERAGVSVRTLHRRWPRIIETARRQAG